MILKTIYGDTKVDGPQAATFTQGTHPPSWKEFSSWDSWSGARVTRDSAIGLPAAADAIRRIAETVAMVPMLVWQGDPVERERARQSWQWELLHESPNPEQSPFDFKQDIATSIESTGDAFIWKLKVFARRVEALYVLDPATITVRRNNANRKVFDVTVDGKTSTFGPQSILHIRGWSHRPGSDRGTSPITLHRHSLGSALALSEFEGRFFRNGAAPSGVISQPGDYKEENLLRYRDQWDERHAGIANAGRPIILYNGATWETMGISLQDAQFVESKGFNTSEIARIFRVDPKNLTGEIDMEKFLKVDLAPRLSRIESALRSDRDLFGGEDDLFPEFLADAVLRPDIKTRYEAYRLARQGGWQTANEIRARENLPALPGGDELQQTPVGGAPNQAGS